MCWNLKPYAVLERQRHDKGNPSTRAAGQEWRFNGRLPIEVTGQLGKWLKPHGSG